MLADYVLALLRHDGDINDVRKLCEEEIPDFLKEDSPVFVSDVFEAIAYRSYLPGAHPPPPKHASSRVPGAPAHLAPNLYYDDLPAGAAPSYPPQFQDGSRKRAYNDWDDPNAEIGRDAGFGGRPLKQLRRGGRGPRQDDMVNFRGGVTGMPPFPPPGQLGHQGPPLPSTVGYFDPKGAMDAIFGMSLATGHPMPELLSHDRGRPPKKRKKCRDWEKKGYCQRGSSCMFDHSSDAAYPALPGPPFGALQPLTQSSAVEGMAQRPEFCSFMVANSQAEYDPMNALMPAIFNGPGPFQGPPPLAAFGQPPRQRGGKHQNRQRRSEKATFSADGPVHDRTKSTIVIENIPEENFNEDQVKLFFSQFGNILEVSMQPYKRLAIVKFDTWDAASAAYHSPKVIFDNRFVKVFWYKDDESTMPASAPMNGDVPVSKTARRTNGSSVAGGNDAGPHADIDMEAFAKQQEEKQKDFEEKTKKREELEHQREELEKRQKELIAKQLEEKAKLAAKLGARNGTKSENNNEDESDPSKPVTQTEALRAQLAALEAEARQMGLDPDAMDAPAPWPTRGGYGRGRAGWRGASPYTPRGSYRGGSFRGRANVHAAYAAYSLDNRPKKVVLTGVDFTVPDKDETLRQYLFVSPIHPSLHPYTLSPATDMTPQGIGEFTDVHTTSASTEITFKDRKTAEKFFNSVLLNNKEIPGLDGSPVELTWPGANGASGSAPTTPGGASKTARAPYPSTTITTGRNSTPLNNSGAGANTKQNKPTTIPTTKPTTAAASNGGAGGDDDTDDDASSDKDVHILLERPPQDRHRDHNEMDYEVADDDRWGY